MKPHAQNITDSASFGARKETGDADVPGRDGPGLNDRLRQLAQVEATEALFADAPLLDRLLREIDETMLPREIVLYTGNTAIGSVLISQRRLVGVALAEGWRGDLIDGLRRLLQLCRSSKPRIERRVSVAPIGAESLSAVAIRQKLGARHARPAAAMTQFLELARPHLLSYILLGEHETEGGAIWGHDVLHQLAAQLPDRTKLRVGTEAMIVPVAAPVREALDVSLIVARAERVRCLALLRTPALVDVGAAWQSVFGALSR